MKLFGNNKNSKHTSNSRTHEVLNKEPEQLDEEIPDEDTDPSVACEPPVESKSYGLIHKTTVRRRKLNNKDKWIRIGIISLSVICVLSIIGIIAAKIWVKPPEVVTKKHFFETHTKASDLIDTDGDGIGDEEPVDPSDIEAVDSRTGGKYTFVMLGTDKVSGSTDTIMVATFDTENYTLNVVSIPRDTLVNVSWSTRKVNTLYSSGGVSKLREGLSDILGYDVDFYVVVNLDAFVEIIDAIGGVDFNVPITMNYDDPAQNLSIHVKKGMQHLDGKTAIGVVRFRKGYSNADIGRIGTQQEFLKTIAKEFLDNKDKVPITTLAKIISNDVDTDLTYGNIIWFAQEALKMDFENITFHTLPGNYGDAVKVKNTWVSYVTIYVNDWLEMINEYLNPFDKDITVSNLNILTRNSSGVLYATNGKKAGSASWGVSSGTSSSTSKKTDSTASSGETSSEEVTENTDPGTITEDNPITETPIEEIPTDKPDETPDTTDTGTEAAPTDAAA